MVATLHPDTPEPPAGIPDGYQLRRISRYARRHEGGHWCVTDTDGRQRIYRVRLFGWPTVASIEDTEQHHTAHCQRTAGGWHVSRQDWLPLDLAIRLVETAEANWCRACRRTARLQCDRPECAANCGAD